MIGEPGIPGLEMSLHSQLRPIIKLLLNILLHCFWLKTQRVAGKINPIIPMVLGNIEPPPEMPEWILQVEMLCKCQGVLVNHTGKITNTSYWDSIIAMTFSSMDMGVGKLLTSTVVRVACTVLK